MTLESPAIRMREGLEGGESQAVARINDGSTRAIPTTAVESGTEITRSPEPFEMRYGSLSRPFATRPAVTRADLNRRRPASVLTGVWSSQPNLAPIASLPDMVGK